MSAKIQHIRHNNQLVGTLAAVKCEDGHSVRIGFSVVSGGDNPSKKFGAEIAIGRAVKGRNKVIPKKIEAEFRDFVSHLRDRREYEGWNVPSVDDFEYSYKPLHQHNHK